MSDIFTNSGSMNVGDVQAAYWNSPLSRTEAQNIFDDYARAIAGQGETIVKVDAAIAFLFDRFGIKPEEFQAWLAKKAEEAAQAPAPEEPKSSLIVEG
jgi:hypothetical protein